MKCAPPKLRYDVSLFNPTHLRENDQDALRGAKQQALKQAGIVLCCPHAKAKEAGFGEGLYKCKQPSLSRPPTFPSI